MLEHESIAGKSTKCRNVIALPDSCQNADTVF